ncbi:MAG: bifunctional hydroxymethylpyrimidine kinase/phosphomethylpyrimidine kinase [Ferrimicrobium sp.]
MNQTRTPPVVLTIAGSDSGGGAGIQADVKTFSRLHVHGTTALTALTAQNTVGVQGIFPVSAQFVIDQIQSITTDMTVRAVKTGMLYRSDIVEAIATLVENRELPHIVVDPVMASATGALLLEADAVTAIRDRLLPVALLATPNLPEAEILTGMTITTIDDMARAARAIHAMGPRAVLVKGGHLGSTREAVDILFDGENILELTGPRITTSNIHGTGCILSAAITAHLARGASLIEAVRDGKRFVAIAIDEAQHWGIGRGSGPLSV